MTLPIPSTYMPGDQLVHADLNATNGLKGMQNAAFNMPRAKLVFTGTGSNTSGVQPIAATFGTGLGSTQYDQAYDGSLMVDSVSRRGFQIKIPGTYRIQARWAWADSASATAGLRYLGLYQAFNTFANAGTAVGDTIAGISGNSTDALDWDIGRRIASNPPTPRLDVTLPFIKGMCLQLGVCQNSTVTLGWLAGAEKCWFSIHMISGGG